MTALPSSCVITSYSIHYTKLYEPDKVITGLGWPDMDAEGRYIEARFGALSVVSVYLPSGSSSEERQAVKFSFLERFMPFLRQLRNNFV